MYRISDKKKCMASLAVFRELYDQKKDIYEIISEFVKQIIIEKGLISINLQNIKDELNNEYGFEIPSAVIKPALKRLKCITVDKNNYTVSDKAILNIDKFKSISEKAKVQNEQIFNTLINYVNEKNGLKLNLKEEEALKKAFCVYVIDELTTTEYSDLISAFLIANKKNEKFVNQLNQIKQGIIIYVGLAYNVDQNSIDSIDSPMHIYMDMEILFSMIGYNGILYKELFDEFYDLTEQINKRAKKRIIYFHYFNETLKEIETYFKTAEQIVRGKITLDPSKQAMQAIVQGCFNAHQIQEKQSLFFKTLKDKGITLDRQNKYYDKGQQVFNIEHSKIYANKDLEASDEEIDRKIKLLNYISIKRGNNNHTIFKNIGHIFLSANRLTFKIAFDKEIKKDKEVPLATSMDFLTKRFWFSLNKGLISNMDLRSFDIITKAQIVLSSKINDSISRLYKELVAEDTEGKFNKEEKKAYLAQLHNFIVCPEDIKVSEEDTYLNVISYRDLAHFKEEQALITAKHRQEQETKEKELDIAKEENLIKDKQLEKAARSILAQRNNEIQQKSTEYYLDYQKKYSDWEKGQIRESWIKNILIAVIYIGLIILLYIFTSNKITNNVYILTIGGLIAFIIPFIRPIVNHNFIKDAFIFCFNKSVRIEYKENLKQKYEEQHPKKIFKLVTLEEILNELKDV